MDVRANPESKLAGFSFSGLVNITNTIAGVIEGSGTSSAGINVTDTSTDVVKYLLKIGIPCAIIAVLVLVILCWKFKDHQLMKWIKCTNIENGAHNDTQEQSGANDDIELNEKELLTTESTNRRLSPAGENSLNSED
uniref:Uncharacterized protein LOC111133788 n=1 Tax=Crassostrea virginica TaxID=6565 RepID=A0A8B8EBY9_CRAVI|nr:uncharacterized protein LOC111133788 [Crassostrea virginica]